MGHLKSASFNFDGKEILIPTVHKGKQLSDNAAVRLLKQGKIKPLGVFTTPQAATKASHMISRNRGINNPSATGIGFKPGKKAPRQKRK